MRRHPSLRGLLAASLGAAAAASFAQSHADVVGTTKPQISAIQADTATRSAAQQKMSSQLIDALKERETGQVNVNAPRLSASKIPRTADGVVVDIKAAVSDDLVSSIERLDGKVMSRSARFGFIRATLPLENVEKLAARPDVQSVSDAVAVRKNSLVASEGVTAHAVQLARNSFPSSGKGVKVGVISDSIDNGYGALEAAQASGAIDPALLATLPGQEGEGTGEGLAMAEIVHAIAPEAEIVFASGYGGPPQMAENILELARAGCRIIVDDLSYADESPFQDGPISIAVKEVSDRGVLYFSSARNSGNKAHGTSGAWEGDFEDGGAADAQVKGVPGGVRIHVFDHAARITLNTVESATQDDRVDLFWSDPLGQSRSQYNLYVVNNKGEVVASSTTTQSGSQDPYQHINSIRNKQSIVITRTAGSGARFLHLDTGRAVLRVSTDGSLRGHNASGAENAFSVAAVHVPSPLSAFTAGTPTAVEAFSSDGPRRMYFDARGVAFTPGDLSSSGGIVLDKPDIAAADGITTTLPTGGLNPFLGTSAAAPHAAGIAALLLACNAGAGPRQVREALTRSAIAIEGGNGRFLAGAGIVMAPDAAAAACHATTTAAATATER